MADPSRNERGEAHLKRNTRLLRLAVFSAAFDPFLLAPMLVSIALDTGTPLTAAAGMASAYCLAYGVMQPVWSVVSDRRCRGAVVRLGLLGAAVTGVLCA